MNLKDGWINDLNPDNLVFWRAYEGRFCGMKTRIYKVTLVEKHKSTSFSTTGGRQVTIYGCMAYKYEGDGWTTIKKGKETSLDSWRLAPVVFESVEEITKSLEAQVAFLKGLI